MALSHFTDGQLVSAADLNALVDAINNNTSFNSPDSGWVNIVPATGYSLSTPPAQMRQIGNIVFMQGTVATSDSSNITTTVNVGSMPSSIRLPPSSQNFMWAGGTGASGCRASISSGGSITVSGPASGTTNYVTLSGSFPVG